MPSLLDIRRRVRAVKSTQQITKAMKMVAASRLRRAQERIQQARPYAAQMRRVLNSLASRVDPSAHPLLDEREVAHAEGRALLIVVTADRGLCGSFNTNVIKAAGACIARQVGHPIELGLVGRKGRDFFKRRGFEVRIEEIGIFQKVRYADAQRIAQAAIEEFTTGQVDSVHIVYNEFKSVMQQRIAIEQILPIPRLEPAGDGKAPVEGDVDYLYEPEPQKIFNELLPRHIEIQIYRALLESAAAEHAARMTAMDAATKNSGEIIDSLTLYMNKVRQAAITREIIEVVSGAQSTS
jgi:F-type H+-transporting ATPase subunit gamma